MPAPGKLAPVPPSPADPPFPPPAFPAPLSPAPASPAPPLAAPFAEPVHVIGASGRSGATLAAALLAAGTVVVPVVRDAVRWRATGLPGDPRIADLADPDAVARALADARLVVSTAHARHAAAVLRAAPTGVRRVVLLGSTRRFSRFPDRHGDGVRAGERAVLGSDRPAIMLHPTMIYGATGENNVRRLAVLARRLPVLPLPGGGRNLVQPIHQDDVTRSVMAALALPPAPPETLVIAGPEPVRYATLLRLVAAAAGARPPVVVPVPATLLGVMAPLTRVLPFLPPIGRDEVRRLLEDKSFDIEAMRTRLGIIPIALADGLARTFGPPVR